MKTVILLLVCSFLCGKEPHPITKVNTWFKKEKELTEGRFLKLANLATVSPDGCPHVRMIKITHLSLRGGALFFTDKRSEKVDQITFNPQGALNFWLPRTRSQISMEGTLYQVTRDGTEKGWKRLPRYEKLNYLLSNPLDPLESNEVLVERKGKLAKDYPKEIPCPSTFIGYRFVPHRIIFYEAHPRSFASKEIATLDDKRWIVSQVEP